MVQGLFHTVPMAPPLVWRRPLDALNAPLLRERPSVVTATLPLSLADRFGVPRAERLALPTRLLGGFCKMLALVPSISRREPLRYP